MATDLSIPEVCSESDDQFISENRAALQIDECHPIEELLNRRSWIKDDTNDSLCEDDELGYELESLSLAEREISLELSDFTTSFRKHGDPSRTDLNLHDDTPTTTIERGDKPRIKKKRHANISNIHQLELDALKRDTRQSPNESQPSDEACNGINVICTRDPPESPEKTGPTEDHDGDCSSSSREFEEIVNHITMNAMGDGDEIHSDPKSTSRHGESFSFAVNEDRFDTISEWDLRPRQSSSIEKRESNLFQEESFWEESFWKASFDSKKSPDVSDEDTNIAELEIEKNKSLVSLSDQRMIDVLSLPTLEHRFDRNEENNVQVKEAILHQTVDEPDFFVADTFSSYCQRKEKVGEVQSTSSRFIDQEIEEIVDRQLDETHLECPLAEAETVVKISHEWQNRVSIRTLVLFVYILLAVIGIAMFCIFFIAKDTSRIQL